MFCRNCGKELGGTPEPGTPEVCANCGANPVAARAFCRTCGSPTTARTVWCPKCGAAQRVIAGSTGTPSKHPRLKTALKILVAVVIVGVYAFFTLPRAASKVVKNAASDVVVAATGYTALPLKSVSAIPTRIPLGNPLNQIANFYNNANNVVIVVFAPGDTKQLTIYATYSNDAGSVSFEEVTNGCTYKSSNEKIAKVNAGGLVQAVSDGQVTITASYTAPQGSANMSAASLGKVPITVSVNVPVIVTTLPAAMGGRPAP